MKTFLPRTAGTLLRLASLAIVGCSSGEARGVPAFQVQDSSGVELVWSGPAVHEGGDAWRVAREPVLQIGEVDGEEPFLFERLGDAVRVPDGRIVISDAGNLDIRVFGPDGRHEVSFGGRGEGPEEFMWRPLLALLPPDTLIAWDAGQYRLSWFDLTGSLLKQHSLNSAVASLPLALGMRSWSLAEDGFLLWTGPPHRGYGDGTLNFTLIDQDGVVRHDFGLYPTFRNVPTSNKGISLMDWFEPSTQVAVGLGPHRVAISSPEEWEVRFFDSGGTLLRVLRAPISRIPVTAEVRAARRAGLEKWASDFRLPAGEGAEIDARLPVPDSLPAIRSLLWDLEGNLWVGRREADPNGTEDFDVFDSSGRWISTVHFPKDIGYIAEIGEDYLLARWYDDLGVPYLRLFGLEKPRN